MLNRTAVHRRQLPRLGYAASLLVLLGTVTALVVAVRIPAHSTTQPAPPPAPGPSAYDRSVAHGGAPAVAAPTTTAPTTAVAVAAPTAASTDDGLRAGTGAGLPVDDASRPAAPARADRPNSPGAPATDLPRSLIWSGVVGLVISLTGIGIVGSRRRMW